MKSDKSNMKRTLIKIVAVLQIVIGGLLMVGIVGLTQPAYRTVRDEFRELSKNLIKSADALDSSRMSYEQSAVSLFSLTGAMDDVAEKLSGASVVVLRTGEWFASYGAGNAHSHWGKIRPFREWFKDSGEKLKEVGCSVETVSEVLKGLSKTTKDYRENRYEKALEALSKDAESLRHIAQVIDCEPLIVCGCSFICLLGFCGSLLFFTNGALLLIVNRLDCKDA